jgi:hypothetical protein
MTSQFESLVSLRALPPSRSVALSSLAVLLAVADWLQPNQFVDPDLAEFLLTMALGLWSVVIALSERLSPDDAAVWRNRLSLAVCTLAVSGLMAEAAARFMFRDITTSADAGSYFSRRWIQRTALQPNNLGFRDRSFASEKPARVYRIAVAGDSFTYGNGIAERDRYTNRMQAWLPDGVEVLNFGVPGDNTPQHYASIVSSVLPSHPDYILLQWFVNDVEGSDVSSRPRYHALLPGALGGEWFAKHSAVYDIASMGWVQWQVRLGLVRSYADYLTARTADPNGPDARREHELLHAMVALARREHSGFGIVLFPDAGYDLGAAYPFGFLHQRVLDDCDQEHITCVDLRLAFSTIKDRRTLWVNRFDHHPSARANEIAALEILKVFQPYWTK